MACFVVTDVETTGLSTSHDRIVSIAASCRGQEFTELVNPGRQIPHSATKVHGITNSAVRNHPRWDVVGARYWEWLDARRVEAGADTVVLVIHNASFDTRIIASEMARICVTELAPLRLEVVDTLRICRARLKLLPRHRQADVYRHLFQEEAPGQHDALGDVRALTRICDHPDIARALDSFRIPLRLIPTADPLLLTAIKPPPPPVTKPSPPPVTKPSPPPATNPSAAKPSPSAAVCDTCGSCYSQHFKHTCAV